MRLTLKYRELSGGQARLVINQLSPTQYSGRKVGNSSITGLGKSSP